MIAVPEVYELPPPKKGIDGYFVTGDWHTDHLHIPTYEILLKTAEMLHPKKSDRKLIINGDFLDMPYLMKKSEGYQRHSKSINGVEDFFIPEFDKETNWGNDRLDELGDVFGEIIFLMGNHCYRLNDPFINEVCPSEYHYYFDLKRALKLEERNIPLLPYGSWLDIGDISITHGKFHGASALKKHYEASGGRSVIYSHVHAGEMKNFMSRGKCVKVWSTPAMCQLNPVYMKVRENIWENGFGKLNIDSMGRFNYNNFTVWDEQLILPDGRLVQ